MGSVKVTREALYQQVWTTPMSKLAAQYGMSGVGLAKVCARLSVPRPARGHWAKLAAGKKVRTPPLPKSKPGEDTFVLLTRDPHPAPPPPRVVPPTVRVPETLADASDAVRALASRLARADVDAHDRIVVGVAERPAFAVTAQAHRRALLMLDALAKAMTERGHSLRFRRSGDQAELSFTVGDESIGVAIIEHLDAHRHVRTREEQERVERGYASGVPKYDRVATGRLQIVMHDATSPHSSWSDSSTRRLENVLGRVVLAVEAVPERRAQRRAEEEERRREAEARMREAETRRARELEAQRRAGLEAERERDLLKRIERFRLARDIREYVGAMGRMVSTAGLTIAEGGPLEEFTVWMLAYADKVDPLTELRVDIEKVARERSAAESTTRE